jgi:hypothetical protein
MIRNQLRLAVMAWPKLNFAGHDVRGRFLMKKALLALATVATLAASTFTTTTPADARCRGCGIGLGILGGAVVGAAIANSYGPRYAPAPGYVVYGGYGEPYPVACPGGYWARRPVAFDPYGNPVRWSRARFICP